MFSFDPCTQMNTSNVISSSLQKIKPSHNKKFGANSQQILQPPFRVPHTVGLAMLGTPTHLTSYKKRMD